MTRFWTSDLHFNHKNIIKYCDRPFDNVEHMNEELVNRWNATVSDNDTVIILGDIALCKPAKITHYLQMLRGNKLLIPGNHDYCWEGRKNYKSYYSDYASAGINMIVQNTFSTHIQGVGMVCNNHFPYTGDSENLDRHPEYRPVNKGSWLLHGHIHDMWKIKYKMLNVGVDVWNYAPVSETQISKSILDYEASIAIPTAP